MGRLIDLTGQRFGMLVVVKHEGFNKSRNALWKCICDCGEFAVVASGDLRRKRGGRKSGCGTISCGCLRKTEPAKANTKHGMFGTRIYTIWSGMIARCENTRHRSFANYGGRGIRVCDEWRASFEAFHLWAAENGYDDTLTIDRVDNDRGYSPDNCRFASNDDQQRNKRNNRLLTARGKTMTLAEWADETGINPATIGWRLNAGWSVEDALFNEVRRSA